MDHVVRDGRGQGVRDGHGHDHADGLCAIVGGQGLRNVTQNLQVTPFGSSFHCRVPPVTRQGERGPHNAARLLHGVISPLLAHRGVRR